MFAVITCLGFLALVGWYSWYKTRGTIETSAGYFMAGNSLGPFFIAGSLLLTNISAELLVGQNGLTYFGNLTPLAWEVWAVRGMILLALLFLPMYLGGAFTTIPEFIRTHYGHGAARLTACLFMFGYIFVWAPSVLYGGALALMKILKVEEAMGLTQMQAMFLVTTAIGLIGALYAVIGGLKAVAISDTLNGCGLLFIGCLIPVLGLAALSDNLGGSMLDALRHIALTHPEKLNAIGSGDDLDAIPIAAVFTGLMVTVTFYWGTNQYVIQRALAARSLKAGQQGLLFAGFFKFLVPFIALFPGILAYHLYGDGLNPRDLAFPTLAAEVLPAPLIGLFAAVLLGAVFTTYNSLLNSAATLFAFDIYQPLCRKKADDAKLIRASRYFGVIFAIFTIGGAPFMVYLPHGIFIFLQQFTGFIAIPLVCLVLLGLFAKRLHVPGNAAILITAAHLGLYYLMVFQLEDVIELHWMHAYGLLFCLQLLLLIIWGLVDPADDGVKDEVHAAIIDMHAWHYAVLTSCLLLCSAGLIYLIFSPLGLAYAEDVVSPQFWPIFSSSLAGSLLFCALMHWKVQPLYERWIDARYQARVEQQLVSAFLLDNNKEE